MGEIQKGISMLGDAERQRVLREWLQRSVAERFEGRLLELDADILLHWGQVLGEQARRGVTVPAVDMLIASTAYIHGLIVVTRNATDMERCGAPIVNPWR